MDDMTPEKAVRACLRRLQEHAANNLSVAQQRLWAAHQRCERQEQDLWTEEANHWLRRCAKWRNEQRRFEAKR